MLTMKLPISQAEELLEWIALTRETPLDHLTYALERGSTVDLPSGAVLLLHQSTTAPRINYYISGYAADSSDVTVYEPLSSYDTDVMDYMYTLAKNRAYKVFGGSEGLYA